MSAGPVLPVRPVCGGRRVPTGRIVPILSAFLWAVVVPPVLAAGPESRAAEARVSGELRKWHRITLSFDGPETSESAEPNPFRDYRLTATFRHPATGKVRVVPGFYAADGNAAESGADRGRVWQVRFAPDETGDWTWAAELRSGRDVAASPEPGAGTQGPHSTLGGVAEITDDVARALAEYEGQLNGLPALTSLRSAPLAAKYAAQPGDLRFAKLTAVSDDVAEALATHKGKLDLSGLQSLSDEAAKALATHDGEVVLTGLTTISESAAAALRANGRIRLPAKFQNPAN